MRRVDIFDSTLRDGAQGEGISFSLEDKLRAVKLLDKLGVAYIEAGNPGSNPKDLEFFARVKKLDLKNSTLVAFGSTRRAGKKAGEDANLNSLVLAGTSVCAIFGKSWDFQVSNVLHVSLEENLEMIKDSVSFLRSKGKRVFFDAEHFFDGYLNNSEYAMKALQAAADAGAEVLVLCETRGGVLPLDVMKITGEVVKAFPELGVAIHAHDDSGCAVASSLMAVEAGASQVQGTLLGFGERCGNTNLSTVIADLELKMGIKAISGSTEELSKACHALATISNVNIPNSMPYVGSSAFAHKGGMHIDGVLKDSASFEHVDPSSVGARRRFLMSEVSGRALIIKRIQAVDPSISKDSPSAKRLVSILKAKEAEGYQFEGAENSFDLIIRRELSKNEPFFELVHYRTIGLFPYPDEFDGATHSAVVKVRVKGETAITAAEGQGPVNALDKALRKVLEPFYPALEKVQLTDYKVRVLEGSEATASRVRVVIDSTDGETTWSTIGVSADIIEASSIALSDSIEYKLTMDKIKGEQDYGHDNQ